MAGNIVLKQCFSIDKNEVLTVCDQVLMMAIGTTQNMKNGGKTSRVEIKSIKFLLVSTQGMGHEFHVAIAVTAKNGNSLQGRHIAMTTEAFQCRLIGFVKSHVFGLVDNFPR